MKKGFTLIELLVVIFIIGLLASIVTVSVNESRKRARDAKRFSDIDSVRTALELYYNSNGKYPQEGSGTTTSCYGTTSPCVKWWKSTPDNAGQSLGWIPFISSIDGGDYVNVLPLDPINKVIGTTTYSYGYASLNDQQYKLIIYNLETTAGKEKASTDGGVVNSWYELFSDGGVCYFNNPNPSQSQPCTVM